MRLGISLSEATPALLSDVYPDFCGFQIRQAEYAHLI